MKLSYHVRGGCTFLCKTGSGGEYKPIINRCYQFEQIVETRRFPVETEQGQVERPDPTK